MAPVVTGDPPSSSTSSDHSDNTDNDLQPCFVLHNALPRKPVHNASKVGKSKKQTFTSSSVPSSKAENQGELYESLRFEAFDAVWSKIENDIKDVLRESSIKVFDQIHHWVHESFLAIQSSGTHSVSDVGRPYPLITDSICRQIYTAFVFTMNVEFFDDLLTFAELGVHLASHGCHVANLSSLDFTVKNGIGGCFRSLLRQLVIVTSDADIAILASWYTEQTNYGKPIAVIIGDMERCSGTVLAQFITVLSEWVIKIPIILIVGVATTIDAPSKLLEPNSLQHLRPCKFTLGSPIDRMDAVIEAVLVKPFYGFSISYTIALFLRNYFLRHDGTVASFVRALKIACMKHFSQEPLSFLAKGAIDEDSKGSWNHTCTSLSEGLLKHAFNLPSCLRDKNDENLRDDLVSGLLELKQLGKHWSTVVMCLFEVGKLNKMQLLDIFCEALDPCLSSSSVSHYVLGKGKDHAISSSKDHSLHDKEASELVKGGVITQMIRKVRDLPVASLFPLLKKWEEHTEEMAEINCEIQELQLELRVEDGDKLLQNMDKDMHESRSQSLLNAGRNKRAVNEETVLLLKRIIREYLVPVESAPFHEIFCFKDVGLLQSALIGDPRREIQVDLLNFHTHLQCSCCSKDAIGIFPSMPDTSIMYNLAQGHGDLINIHDWYQSFKTLLLGLSSKRKRKMDQSPTTKKRKSADQPATDTNEASIQARFCRAVTELQITGLLRMPSKRRPDYVQRVAFGL